MSLYGNIPRYIKLNLVQNLLGEVKEKEYFVADKMKKIFEKNLEVSDCKLVRQLEYKGRPPGGITNDDLNIIFYGKN